MLQTQPVPCANSIVTSWEKCQLQCRQNANAGPLDLSNVMYSVTVWDSVHAEVHHLVRA